MPLSAKYYMNNLNAFRNGHKKLCYSSHSHLNNTHNINI